MDNSLPQLELKTTKLYALILMPIAAVFAFVPFAMEGGYQENYAFLLGTLVSTFLGIFLWIKPVVLFRLNETDLLLYRQQLLQLDPLERIKKEKVKRISVKRFGPFRQKGCFLRIELNEPHKLNKETKTLIHRHSLFLPVDHESETDIYWPMVMLPEGGIRKAEKWMQSAFTVE